MTSNAQFTAILDDDAHSTSRAVRHIVLHPDIAKSLKLSTSDPVAVLKSDSTSGSAQSFAVGTIWPSPDCPPNLIQLSSSLLLATSAASGDLVQLAPLSSTKASPLGLPSLKAIQEAKTVVVTPGGTSSISKKTLSDKVFVLLIRECLVNIKHITLNQEFEVPFEGSLVRLKIQDVTDANIGESDQLVKSLDKLSVNNVPSLWTFGWESTVVLSAPKPPSNNQTDQALTEPENSPLRAKQDGYSSIGGLSKQISQIRDLLEIPLTRPELFDHLGLKPPRGILLHGPPGTGKTHLARAIAASTNSSVIVINGPELSSAYHGETESKLRDVFTEAREKSPCIVVLDEVDALVPRREDGGGGEVEKRVVATLLTILDGMHDESGSSKKKERVVVIGTTNRPNAIDPALRRPGRFDKEIEIGVPDAEARFSILQVLLAQAPHKLSELQLRSFASKAHGYVGADLSAVVREAGTTAIKRFMASSPTSTPTIEDLSIMEEDMLSSMLSIRPSAMRSLFIESPRVRYSDIGGQADVIQKLRESVEWPLLHPGAFQRLGVKPPKGVLLYGPPGCSKTVLARACASESGVNFVAVKGPELLNKFVGESERAVRETFRKARAAAPSIVFFDEIDALGTSRTSDEGTSGSAHEGVLTSLLNEMDGVQELVGVTVIAATNRPEALDSALMRPGRLDRLLYVGPPDQKAREEILSIRLKEMKVDPSIDIPLLAQKCDGCSGAEIAALCQEAALFAMKEDINIPYVPQDAFYYAAGKMKRQITRTVIDKFQRWTDANGN